MDVSVVIGTYGDSLWREWAKEAAGSVPETVPVHCVHGPSLYEARNEGLKWVRTEWVVHLDADDFLDCCFFRELEQAPLADLDLVAPAVHYLHPTKHHEPGIPRVAGHRHDCEPDCLKDGNWLIVGALARTALVRQVGGWRPWACYEDWDLWQRMWLAGARIGRRPEAIYHAQWRADSRNRGTPMEERDAVHRAIVANNMP